MTLSQNLLHLSLLHILAAMVPGPNTVVVAYFSGTVSRRAGLYAAAGITLTSLAWVSLSLFGLGVVLLEAGDLYRAIRYLGAMYLVVVGIQMLWRAWRSTQSLIESGPASTRAPFTSSVLTNVSNPKSAVFWTSVFALLVPPNAPVWFIAAAVAIVVGQTALWYSFVAFFISTFTARKVYTRLGRWLDIIAGAVMVALGLRLAFDVRQ
jgi:threonine/homoserine/homoserine lactone efflux protein